MPCGWIYILANDTGTLYTGVTSDLYRRVLEHRDGIRSGFAAKYHCHRLVYCEEFEDIVLAIAREKTIKGWTRIKKLALIESKNSQWNDLAKYWGKQMLTPGQSIAEENVRQKSRIHLSLIASKWLKASRKRRQ